MSGQAMFSSNGAPPPPTFSHHAHCGKGSSGLPAARERVAALLVATQARSRARVLARCMVGLDAAGMGVGIHHTFTRPARQRRGVAERRAAPSTLHAAPPRCAALSKPSLGTIDIKSSGGGRQEGCALEEARDWLEPMRCTRALGIGLQSL